MIPDMGPHAAFIWMSYAIMTGVLAALIAWLILDGRKQSRLLAALEARSAKRSDK
ncbi:MAG: heme exporter protein CcmD [Hyphomicrobiaceae bacterium]